MRVLGPEVGAVLADLHAEHRVDLHLGTDRAHGVRPSTADVFRAGAVDPDDAASTRDRG